MELILKEDIAGLGYKNDIVNVKPGYGRNYLIPQGFAVVANASSKKVMQENIKQAAHKVEKIRKDAQDLADAIGEMNLEIPAKVGESGKIFGKVTTVQIADALKAKGFNVDRKKISFETEVKTEGDYTVLLDLHKEVKHKVNFKVVAA